MNGQQSGTKFTQIPYGKMNI